MPQNITFTVANDRSTTAPQHEPSFRQTSGEHESNIRQDYREKFGSAARERQKVEEYRRWEMGQLLYGPAGRPYRQKSKIVTPDHFEHILKEMSELYDVDYESIPNTVPEAKRVASVHAKGCFICRLCRHTWASEMSWVDIDLWDRSISSYYQQKCMHCCEEKDSAAIPMFTDTQLRRLICRGFLRGGLIRTATLSLKVFLAGPSKPKSTESRPHLGLLCGKCGYENCDLPPCSAAQASKERADKKLSTLFEDMRDKATAETKPGGSGEMITIANNHSSSNAGTAGAVIKTEAPDTLRHPKCGSASHKRPHFKTFSSAAANDSKVRIPVKARLGPVNKIDPEPEPDLPAAKRPRKPITMDGLSSNPPRKPITMDGLSSNPDNDDYVAMAPNVNRTTGKRGRRQKSLLLSHMERAAANKARANKQNGDTAVGGDSQPISIKTEKPWQQFSITHGNEGVPAQPLESRTQEEWQQECLLQVEDADGEVEYMYSVNPDGDLFPSHLGQQQQQQQQTQSQRGAAAGAEPSPEPMEEEEALVVGPDGQPMRIKTEKFDPAYNTHLNGQKPIRIKQEQPWMQGGKNPFEDDLSALVQDDMEEEDGGMFLVEDADGDVEYLYTTYKEPEKVTIDDGSDGEGNGSTSTDALATVANPTAATVAT